MVREKDATPTISLLTSLSPLSFALSLHTVRPSLLAVIAQTGLIAPAVIRVFPAEKEQTREERGQKHSAPLVSSTWHS